MTESAQCNCHSPAVCCQGVSFAYERETIIAEADFDIEAGESISVIGPNGGGKTTLLKLLLGLLKPDTGSIRIFDKAPGEGTTDVGYVPQSLSLDRRFPITAIDIVGMGLLHKNQLWGMRRDERDRAWQALKNLGLDEIAKKPFAHLSGGQKQGVLLARALVGNPRLLVLDEPTTHIDAAAQERLEAELKRLRGSLTLITVSHDLHFVSRGIGRVICVNRSVRVHPVEALEGDLTQRLFGQPVALVKHTEEQATRHAHGHAAHDEKKEGA
jgi:zinc transport system ATP-binding protein